MIKRGHFASVFVFGVLWLVAVGELWLHIRQKRQSALSEQLIEALIPDDTKTALSLVNAGADPNTHCKSELDHSSLPAKDTPTAFMLACGQGWNRVNGRTLIAPEIKENLPLLNAMLARGANLHADGFYQTPLHIAVSADRERTAELLIQHGADINERDWRGRTPLMLVDTVNMTHLLLAHGANPNIQDDLGDTALHTNNRRNGNKQITHELLAHGADASLRDTFGELPAEVSKEPGRYDRSSEN